MYRATNERFVLETKENIAENLANFSLKVMNTITEDGRHMASTFFFLFSFSFRFPLLESSAPQTHE